MSSHRVAGSGSKQTPRSLLLAVAAVLALLTAACGGDDVTGTSGASEVAAAPGVVPTAGGGQLDFGDLEGSPAMLWFWAPW
ncbi:MAG: hypothetical protein ACE367_23475 [Acidimicrobiales bacterium]